MESMASFVKEHLYEIICGSLGLGMACVWVFSLLLFQCDGFFVLCNLEHGFVMPKITVLLSYAIAGIIATILSRIVNSAIRFTVLWVAVTVFELVALVVPPLQPLKVILMAMSIAMLLALWAVWLLQREMLFFILGLALAFAGIICNLVIFIPAELLDAFTLMLLFGSFLFYTSTVLPFRTNLAFSTVRETKWKGFFETSHFIFMRVMDVVLGMALYLVCATNDSTLAFTLAGCSLLVTGVCVIVLSRAKLYMREKAITASLLCGVSLLLVALVYTDSFWTAICGTALLSVVSTYKISNSLNYTARIILKPFSELFYFGFLCTLTSFGMLVGLLGTHVAYSNSYSFFPLALLLVVMFMTLLRLKCFSVDESPDIDKIDPNSYWYRQVQIIARRYGLTPRQTDILHGLSRGRNAKFLEEKFVLSSGTVKTHIRTIYEKMGVHSQQELMDMVRDARESEEMQMATANSVQPTSKK